MMTYNMMTLLLKFAVTRCHIQQHSFGTSSLEIVLIKKELILLRRHDPTTAEQPVFQVQGYMGVPKATYTR